MSLARNRRAVVFRDRTTIVEHMFDIDVDEANLAGVAPDATVPHWWGEHLDLQASVTAIMNQTRHRDTTAAPAASRTVSTT